MKNAFSVDGLVERPAPEEHDGKARNDENAFVRGIWRDVADEDVIDQVGSRGEQVVRRGGDDLGENGAKQDRAEKAGSP